MAPTPPREADPSGHVEVLTTDRPGGDFLVIGCAGAYGFVMASNYNGKPRPAEVLIRDGKAHLVRARESLDDLLRGESIPS